MSTEVRTYIKLRVDVTFASEKSQTFDKVIYDQMESSIDQFPVSHIYCVHRLLWLGVKTYSNVALL